MYVAEIVEATDSHVTVRGFIDGPDGNAPVTVVLHGATPLLADIGFP